MLTHKPQWSCPLVSSVLITLWYLTPAELAPWHFQALTLHPWHTHTHIRQTTLMHTNKHKHAQLGHLKMLVVASLELQSHSKKEATSLWLWGQWDHFGMLSHSVTKSKTEKKVISKKQVKSRIQTANVTCRAGDPNTPTKVLNLIQS